VRGGRPRARLTGTARRRLDLTFVGPGERLSFVVATGLAVLYFAVDGFVTPAAGTTPGDHLVPVLVPVGLVALAVWLHPRLRAGLRATLALVLGVLEAVLGATAVAGVRGGAPAGSDWVGLLLLPAGAVLCVLGVRLLWRSRRPEGHKYLRRAVYAVGGLLLLYYVVLPVSIAIVATHRPHEEPRAADLGRPYRDVGVRTGDGLLLDAWYVPSRNGAAVITFPREWTTAQARMLVAHGYGVLLLDMRGYGTSQGETNAYGWGAAKDIVAGVGFLESRPDVKRGHIGGLGLSVGGEQMLEAAASDTAIAAVVAEGAGYRSVRDGLVRRGVRAAQIWLQLPQDAAQTVAVAALTGVAPPPGLSSLVSRMAPRPVMFIYGEHDNEGERSLTPVYFDAARPPKELWEVPGAGHTEGLAAQSAAYEQRVIGFFDDALLGGQGTRQ
jgi:dienelactone hydrolase